MNISGVPYYELHKNLLSGVGLWPYQSHLRNLCLLSLCGITVLFTAIPTTLGLRSDFSQDFVIFCETILLNIVMCGGLLQIYIFHTRRCLIQLLYKRIDADWQSITDAKELKILHKFSENGRLSMWFFIAINYLAYIGLGAATFGPLAMDREFSHNYSRVFPYYSPEWIIDSSTDFARNFQVALHSSIGFSISIPAYLVTQVLYTCSVQHICGLFAIIAWVHLIQNIFNEVMFITEVFLLFCLAMVLFDFKYNISNVRLVSRGLLVVISFTSHAFCINYGGEQIRRYSSQIHSSTYFEDWYLISSKAQKMLLMIMQKSSRPDCLQVGIFVLSMENFAMVLKASWTASTIFLTTSKK